MKRMKELELQFQEREENLKQSVLRKKKDPYAYKKIEKEWQTSCKEEREEKEKRLKQIHERHQLNIKEINNHDRKYS